MTSDLDLGRAAFDEAQWADAFDRLTAADALQPLDGEDLERLAVAAALAGHQGESEAAWERAHHTWTDAGDAERAARCAFWLAFRLLNTGEVARGSGWVDRARRLLDEHGVDCVEHGYLRYCAGLRAVLEGDVDSAHPAFVEAAALGTRFRTTELSTLARVGEGRCLIYMGDLAQGMARLDEAMVSVTAREVSPIAVGDIYCTVIDACQELFDVRRATDWTAVLNDWCESQPQLVLYRGQCLVHRAEIMQLRGNWPDALAEADRLGDGAMPAEPFVIAAAHYRAGELHRVLGDLAQAEGEYRAASQAGLDPQPGLALLRLAQGKVDAALAAIRRALDEASDPISRSRLLGPFVEIALASNDVDAARGAAMELQEIAAQLRAPYLAALAAQAMGAVDLADGDVRSALPALRRAVEAWRDLEAPYEMARVRVLLAAACRASDDEDGARLELDGAQRAFTDLGAQPDLDRLAVELGTADAPDGLSPRELEVLALLAAGRTNRDIAGELLVSPRTVDNHVRNIFTKLGVANRAAATSYAHEHGLLRR